MTTAKPTAVTRYQASPGVRSTYTDGVDEVALSGGVSLERNVPEVALNRQDPRVRGEWRHLAPRTSSDVYALYEQSAYRNLALVESIPLNVDGTRRLAAVGGTITREMSESGTIALNGRQESTRFSTPGVANYSLTSGGAQYTHALRELTSWYVSGDTQRFRPEPGSAAGAGAGASQSDGVLLGYRTAFLDDKLQIDAAAGRLRFTGPTNGSSWQGSLKLTYSRPFTDLSLEASRRASPQVSASALGAVTSLRLTSKTTVSEDTSVLIDFSRSKTNAFPRSVGSSISLAVARQLSSRMQATLRAERRSREDIVSGRAQASILTASLMYSFADF
jgi:hypothetical protein